MQPGQAYITHNGKQWHFYFGIDASMAFLHLNRRLTKVEVTQKSDTEKQYIEEMRDLPLSQFHIPFIENEGKALLDIFWCALLCGDTKHNITIELNRDNFGRFLDEAEPGAFATLVAAYTSSKPLGK